MRAMHLVQFDILICNLWTHNMREKNLTSSCGILKHFCVRCTGSKSSLGFYKLVNTKI